MTRGARSVVDPIEFLAPRDSLFGGDCPAEFAGFDIDDMPDADDEAPHRPWLTGVVGLAVVGLIGVGVVAAAPWDSPDSNVAPPPTTIVPPETAPTETTLSPVGAAALAPATGWVFDPVPDGFAIRGAWRDNSAPVQHPIPGWGEVWATADATATGGSWFSVTLLNHGLDTVPANATRVDLGVRVALLERAGGNTWRLTAPVGHTDNNQVLSVRSSGRSTDQLIALFQSIGVDDDRPQMVDDRPTYLDPTQLDGFVKIAAEATDQDLIDAYVAAVPTSTTTYHANGPGDGYIIVATAPFDGQLEALDRLAVGPARIFAGNASVPSSFTGSDLVLGASPESDGSELLARWIDHDTVVVVRTNLPLGDFLDLLPTLRPTSPREWNGVQRRADETDPAPVQATGGTPFAGGDLDDGTTWSATVQPPDRGLVQIDGSVADFQLLPAGSPAPGPIHVFTFATHTVVTAVTGIESTATTLRVVADGRTVSEATMAPVNASDRRSSFTGLAAGVALVQTGPFEVDLLDADGNVLAHVASPVYST